MTDEDQASNAAPSWAWRIASRLTMAGIGLTSKTFLNLFSTTTVTGMDEFAQLLDERMDVEGRTRGLLTVSNHLSVIDDPVIWGTLPIRFLLSPNNLRWSLGSEDICFVNGQESVLSKFFIFGQTLPTHRAMYSPHGGLFQPTITQCIRLLSAGPFTSPTPRHPTWPSHLGEKGQRHRLTDPFTDPTHVYTTTGRDEYHAPSSYASRRHAWVHMFPEGRVHQHPTHGMRYFKWGAARLILESEPCPDVVPIFIEGFAEVMREERPDPRWKPTLGTQLGVTFGAKMDPAILEGFRERWRRLRVKFQQQGTELHQELMTGKEVTALRIEIATTLRGEIEKLRRSKGYPDEDPKTGLWETWKEEGSLGAGQKQDGSVVGTT